jgi:serine/threonine protein kinase
MRNLGSGAYATVKLATHVESRKKMALKIYPLAKVDQIKRKAVQTEIAVMKQLRSEHFPKLYAHFETQKEIVLV